MSVLFIREVFDAAKGMIIHRKMFKKLQSLVGNFSQIWLQTRYEVQIFNHPSKSFWLHTGKQI